MVLGEEKEREIKYKKSFFDISIYSILYDFTFIFQMVLLFYLLFDFNFSVFFCDMLLLKVDFEFMFIILSLGY